MQRGSSTGSVDELYLNMATLTVPFVGMSLLPSTAFYDDVCNLQSGRKESDLLHANIQIDRHVVHDLCPIGAARIQCSPGMVRAL